MFRWEGIGEHTSEEINTDSGLGVRVVVDRLKSRFLGSLVGAGVGDSLGAGSGRYTDDTAMMIGVTESLIENGAFDEAHMAQVFIENYNSEPWRGYGPGPPGIFQMVKAGLSWKEAAEKIYPGGSYGNGSAMRVAPVGLFYYDDPDQLKDVAYKSSRITHCHPLGMEGAALQAYAVALALRTEPDRLDAGHFVKQLDDFVQVGLYREKLNWMRILLSEAASESEVIRRLGNTIEAFNSVAVSIYSFLVSFDFESALRYALSLDGDRDTISAMTGAVAGACHGIEGIPREWREGLENRDYIEEIAEKLWQAKNGRMQSARQKSKDV